MGLTAEWGVGGIQERSNNIKDRKIEINQPLQQREKNRL